MDKTLEHLKETLEDEIKKSVKKGDITPAELESAYRAVKTMDIIDDMCAREEGYSGYSGRPHGTMRYSYDYHDSSYDRGRSPVTGRYISRDSGYGYSGHSIADRMVAKLESMYDEAKTDYERRTVDEWINKLRLGN